MKNSLLLLLAQLSNFLLPLLALPLLVKATSTAEFGKLIVALGVTTYFVIILEYSFSIIVPRSTIKYKLVKTFYYVLIYRIIAFVMFVIILFFFKNTGIFYILMSLTPFFLAQALMPISVYLIADMIKEYTFYSFLSKSFLLFCVVILFVNDELTITLYVVLLSSISLLASFILIRAFVIKNNIFLIKDINLKEFISFIKSGGIPFLSSIVTSGYNISNVFYISFYYGYAYVAIYGLTEKYVRAGISLLSSFTLSGYNDKSGFKHNLLVVSIVSIIFLLLWVAFYNVTIIWELLGFDFTNFDYRILFIAVPVALMAYFIQLHGFYVNGKDKEVVKISMLILLFHIIFSNIFGYLGLLKWSLSMLVICEAVTLLLYVFMFKLREK